MARSLLNEGTARKVDRLARRAHAFHRFAHHPLCQRYAGELIPLGRRARLCRGCACAAAGTLAGAGGALFVRAASSTLFILGALGLATLLGSLAARLPKVLGRGLAVALLSFACVAGLLASERAPRSLALALLAFGAVFIALYRRRGPDRSPCQSCPERQLVTTCSGLRPIVQRERAFRRLAQRVIDAAALNR
jgi:hypothetical protein